LIYTKHAEDLDSDSEHSFRSVELVENIWLAHYEDSCARFDVVTAFHTGAVLYPRRFLPSGCLHLV